MPGLILGAYKSFSEARRAYAMRMKRASTVQSSLRVGRTEPCPCGSGKKYKRCCLLAVN